LNFLASDDALGRKPGTPAYDLVAAFIEEKFEAHGIRPYASTYRIPVESVKDAYNLVGVIPSANPSDEFVVLGAHLDHIGLDSKSELDSIFNGANDNASGSTAVIQIAQYLSKKKINKNVLVCLFSAEEMGLVGSKELAEDLQDLNITSMINFEMIGVPLTAKPQKAYLTGYEKSDMAQLINEMFGSELIIQLAIEKRMGLFMRSDNFPFFLKHNIPAHTISTFDFNNYDYYHHLDDESSNLDATHMAKLIEKCATAIEKLLNHDETPVLKKKNKN